MSAVIGKQFGLHGGSGLGPRAGAGNNLREILISLTEDDALIRTSLNALITSYNAHAHSFDGTAAADSVSGDPVTGAATGSATGGAAENATAAGALGTTVAS